LLHHKRTAVFRNAKENAMLKYWLLLALNLAVAVLQLSWCALRF